jgi:DNA polymerase-3 subunit gamma/tau
MPLIVAHLERLLQAESVDTDVAALRLLARAADGSMRDALSLLDQAIAYGGGAVHETEVRAMLGTIEQTHVIELLRALAAGDGGAMLQIVERLSQQLPDYEGLLAELLSYLQQIAVAQTLPDALDENLDEREAVLELAEQMAAEDVQLFYQIGLLGRRDLQMAPDLRGGLEMVLLRMLAFRPLSAEEQPRAQQPQQSRAVPQPDHQVKKAAQAPVQARGRPATPANDWRGLVESMQLKGVLRELAMNCALKNHDGDSWKLVLDTSHQQLLSKARQQRLESALCEVLQRKVHVEIEVQGGTDDTPAQQQLNEAEARQADAVTAIESDANVKAIQKVFDATLHRETIRSVDN